MYLNSLYLLNMSNVASNLKSASLSFSLNTLQQEVYQMDSTAAYASLVKDVHSFEFTTNYHPCELLVIGDEAFPVQCYGTFSLFFHCVNSTPVGPLPEVFKSFLMQDLGHKR